MHGEHDVADVLQSDQAPGAAHVVELAALRIEPATGVGVVGGQGALYLLRRQTYCGNLGRIQQHLVLHGAATEARVIRHTGNGFELGFDGPVLEGFEFHRRPVGALQHVAVNQTRGRGQRCHGRGDAAWQIEIGHSVKNLLASEIIIRANLKSEDYVGQSVERD